MAHDREISSADLVPGSPSNDELWWLKDLFSLAPELKKITSAVTIHGTKDALVPFSNVAFMKKKLCSSPIN
jgi:hypothetical protein